MINKKLKRLIIIIQIMITSIFFLGCKSEEIKELNNIKLNQDIIKEVQI